MDYVFASILCHINPKLSKVALYDIACQWSIHVLKQNLPPLVRLNAILQLAFLIPKLHIYSHKLLCQISYSFHLHPGVSNTDGEGIERSHATPWMTCGAIGIGSSLSLSVCRTCLLLELSIMYLFHQQI